MTKRGGHRGYDKVLERVGKLRNRCTSVSRFYEITVEQSGDQASAISWSIQNEEELKARFCGGYFIRNSRKDLDEVGLWSLYTTLTVVEESFRSLKSDLGLRPM